VYTARCGAGLRCYPPRGEPRPLRTLMHGQGVCTDLADVEAIQESLQPQEKEEIEHPNNSFSPCSLQDRKCLQKQQAKRVGNGNKMRSSGSHREETRPICHPALDGQRGKCWCVDRKTGVKLPGFLELKGDLDCHQAADSM
ncbi:PREDICTED: insulin-like growth factor-binding protein 4, partial [Tinamus guttatus]|uniref:insulin-like growth factor-binding protein 4 n=1 Tax=Tinamus guttatus TaxID=94827 RepID=UPI00052F0F64